MPTLQMEVHETLKQRIVADARENDRSINDLVREILAGHFGVRYEPTGRRTNGTSGSNKMPLPLPSNLYAKIEVEARRRERDRRRGATDGRTPVYPKRELVERILCEHYGLEYVERP